MSPDSFLKMPRGRVRFEVDEPNWEGVQAYFEHTEDKTDVQVMFSPQIVVTFEDGRKKSFGPEQLKTSEALKGAKSYRAYADSTEDLKRIAAALESLGIQPKWGEEKVIPPSEDGMASVAFYAVYDDISRRLAAKIALNYLAYFFGGPFALKEEFNVIRRFIRYGEGPGAELVATATTPVLSDERNSAGWYSTDDHLVTISRSDSNGLVAGVSLFNLIHNRVVLSKTDPEIIDTGRIPSGYRFSWRSHAIAPLLGWADHNVVQPADVIAEMVRRRRRR